MLVSSEDCVKLADFGLSRWIDERDYYSGLYLYLLSSYLSDCFLKQLKRAGVPHAHLLHFYLAVIRPVLEYAAPVWHHSLNKRTKQYKKRQYESYLVALVTCLILGMSHVVGMSLYCCWTGGPRQSQGYCHTIFSNLFYYRHLVYIVYFRQLAILNYCLALGLPPISNRTKKYQSFISYAVPYSPLPVV